MTDVGKHHPVFTTILRVAVCRNCPTFSVVGTFELSACLFDYQVRISLFVIERFGFGRIQQLDS